MTGWTAKDFGRRAELVAVGASNRSQTNQHDDGDRQNPLSRLHYRRGKHVSQKPHF